MTAVDIFWDTNIFGAWLYEDNVPGYDVPSIEQYLNEARDGKWKIYTSSVAVAEIATSKIKKKSYGTMRDLLNDLVGSVVVVDASINIFELAGRLKDIPYRKNNSEKRVLTLGDATMLATILHLEDAYGVKIDCFHTYDNTKKKEIPLLSYHEWCEGLAGEKLNLANRICQINRCKPVHSSPRLIA